MKFCLSLTMYFVRYIIKNYYCNNNYHVRRYLQNIPISYFFGVAIISFVMCVCVCVCIHVLYKFTFFVMHIIAEAHSSNY